MRSLLLPSLHSLDSLYFQGKDLYILSDATSATIINSESTMDIEGTTSKIVACSGSTPCTSVQSCSAASSPLDGVLCTELCTCSNGTPKTGSSNCADNPEKCQSCNSGFYLSSSDTCIACTSCSSGFYKTGTACDGTGTTDTQTCAVCTGGDLYKCGSAIAGGASLVESTKA